MKIQINTAGRFSAFRRVFIQALAGVPFQGEVSKLKMRLAISAFYFCMGLSFASWASRIPDIKTKLQLSEAGLGTILLALPIGQLLMMPFSGRLVTKYGSRTILALAILIYAVALNFIGWASAPWQLALALFSFGVFGNMCNISVNTQGVMAEKIYQKPIMSSFHGAWSIAGFTGALIGLMMMNLGMSTQQHFFIVALMVLTISFIARKYLVTAVSSAGQKRKFFSKPEKVLLQLGMIAFCCMAAEGAMFDWSGVYFKEVVHAPHGLVILGYASFMIMMASGRFVGDRLIARIGRKKMLQLSGALIAAGLLLSVALPFIVTATIGFIITGFGVSTVVPTVYSTAGTASKTPPAIALAAVSSISFLGFLMGPPLIGYIAEIAGLQYSFAVIAMLGFCISIMVSRMSLFKQ